MYILNRVFIVPLLSLFLILIPVVGIFLCITIISFWFVLKYNSIFKALNEPSQEDIKEDIQSVAESFDSETVINTKKYKIDELKDSEAEKLR